MGYNMDKMDEIKKWFYEKYIKRNWEEIQCEVYDLCEHSYFSEVELNE